MTAKGEGGRLKGCPKCSKDMTTGPQHNGIWLVIASGMTIFFFLKTGLNLKETIAKNILAFVSVDFSTK